MNIETLRSALQCNPIGFKHKHGFSIEAQSVLADFVTDFAVAIRITRPGYEENGVLMASDLLKLEAA